MALHLYFCLLTSRAEKSQMSSYDFATGSCFQAMSSCWPLDIPVLCLLNSLLLSCTFIKISRKHLWIDAQYVHRHCAIREPDSCSVSEIRYFESDKAFLSVSFLLPIIHTHRDGELLEFFQQACFFWSWWSCLGGAREGQRDSLLLLVSVDKAELIGPVPNVV